MTPLIGLAQLLGVGFVLYLLTLIVHTMWSLTHPHRQTYASALVRNLPGDPSELDEPLVYDERTVAGTRHPLAVWDIVGRDPGGPVVLMTHGWGSSRQGALKRIQPIAANASRIIVWDLPGHGDSGGVCRMGADEHCDAERVLEACIDEPTPLVLFGWSMGAGVTLALAGSIESGLNQTGPNQDQYRLLGVICESPYVLPQTPARNVIRLRGIPYRLNLRPAIALLGTFLGIGPRWRGFDRARIAGRVSVPLLVLHGSDDPVCPQEDAQRIAQGANNGRLVTINAGGHNNLWIEEDYRQQMGSEIDAFMRSLPGP